jgi:hypothetical protein
LAEKGIQFRDGARVVSVIVAAVVGVWGAVVWPSDDFGDVGTAEDVISRMIADAQNVARRDGVVAGISVSANTVAEVKWEGADRALRGWGEAKTLSGAMAMAFSPAADLENAGGDADHRHRNFGAILFNPDRSLAVVPCMVTTGMPVREFRVISSAGYQIFDQNMYWDEFKRLAASQPSTDDGNANGGTTGARVDRAAMDVWLDRNSTHFLIDRKSGVAMQAAR